MAAAKVSLIRHPNPSFCNSYNIVSIMRLKNLPPRRLPWGAPDPIVKIEEKSLFQYYICPHRLSNHLAKTLIKQELMPSSCIFLTAQHG